MQIKNLMSEDIITVDKDQNLSDALKLLRKHNVSRLPVTNNKMTHYKLILYSELFHLSPVEKFCINFVLQYCFLES